MKVTHNQPSPAFDAQAAAFAAQAFLAEGIPSAEIRATAGTSPFPEMLHAVADAMDAALLRQISAGMTFVGEVAEQIARRSR